MYHDRFILKNRNEWEEYSSSKSYFNVHIYGTKVLNPDSQIDK